MDIKQKGKIIIITFILILLFAVIANQNVIAAYNPFQTFTNSVGNILAILTIEDEDGDRINITDNGEMKCVNVDPDDPTRFGEFNTYFRIPVYMNVEHHEIHEGDSYERHIDSANAAVAGLNVAFKTAPGIKLDHMLFGWSSSDEILFEIIEGATWDNGTGTPLNISNINRDMNKNSTAILENFNQVTFTANNQVMKDVTGIAGGTVIDPQYTYNAGLGAATIVETRNAGHEWILRNNETYIVRMTKTDSNCKMSINLHWYEHTSE